MCIFILKCISLFWYIFPPKNHIWKNGGGLWILNSWFKIMWKSPLLSSSLFLVVRNFLARYVVARGAELAGYNRWLATGSRRIYLKIYSYATLFIFTNHNCFPFPLCKITFLFIKIFINQSVQVMRYLQNNLMHIYVLWIYELKTFLPKIVKDNCNIWQKHIFYIPAGRAFWKCRREPSGPCWSCSRRRSEAHQSHLQLQWKSLLGHCPNHRLTCMLLWKINKGYYT